MRDQRREAMLMRAANPALAAALAKCTSILLPTATSGAVASVADAKNAGSPATQASANFRPTGIAASSGVAQLSCDGDGATGDFLSVPLANAVNNGSPRWGIACWLRPGIVTGVHGIWGCRATAGASTDRLEIEQFGTSLLWDVTVAAFSVRRGTYSSIFALNTDVFLTCEYDGDQSTDAAKAIVTANAVAVTGVFSNDTGTPNAMPATLIQPTGTACWGERRSTSTLSPWNGRMGALMIAQPSVSLSGGGIWTAAERNALMRYLRPTV